MLNSAKFHETLTSLQNLPLPTPVNQNLNCHSEKPVPPAKNLKLPDPEPGLDRAMAGNIDLEVRVEILCVSTFLYNDMLLQVTG